MREHNKGRELPVDTEPPGAREDRDELFEPINEEYRAAFLYEGPDAGELFDGDIELPDGTPPVTVGVDEALLLGVATLGERSIGGGHDGT